MNYVVEPQQLEQLVSALTISQPVGEMTNQDNQPLRLGDDYQALCFYLGREGIPALVDMQNFEIMKIKVISIPFDHGVAKFDLYDGQVFLVEYNTDSPPPNDTTCTHTYNNSSTNIISSPSNDIDSDEKNVFVTVNSINVVHCYIPLNEDRLSLPALAKLVKLAIEQLNQRSSLTDLYHFNLLQKQG